MKDSDDALAALEKRLAMHEQRTPFMAKSGESGKFLQLARDALALLKSRQQQESAEPVREVGWLVEKHEKGRIFYLRIDNCGEGYAWHEDSLKATRFARREDAEHAAEGGELHDLRIAEHMWVPR